MMQNPPTAEEEETIRRLQEYLQTPAGQRTMKFAYLVTSALFDLTAEVQQTELPKIPKLSDFLKPSTKGASL